MNPTGVLARIARCGYTADMAAYDPSSAPNRIRFMRERAGLTQHELADALNTGRSTVVKLEKGERPLTQEWMDRISKIVGCKPYELMPDAPLLTTDEQMFIESYRLLDERERQLVALALRRSDPSGA